MILRARIKLVLPEINCANTDELTRLVTRIVEAARTVVPSAAASSAIEIDESVTVEQEVKAVGGAEIDGYMKVKRVKDGSEEFYRITQQCDHELHPISQAEYDAAHKVN